MVSDDRRLLEPATDRDAGERTTGRSRVDRTAVAAAVGAAAVSLVVFLAVRRGLIDDAYITLSYARNLAEHFHWGLTRFRTANTATSPLNVLALAAGALVTGDAVRGLGLLFVLCGAAQAGGLVRLCRRLGIPTAAGIAAFLLLLLSPLMLSIVGMEMTLAATLLVWLVVAAVEGRPVAFGVLTGALVLTRVDLAVFPLVVLLTTPPLLRRVLRVLAAAVLTVLPWYLFSWLVLGALLPDTVVIKVIAGVAWGPWRFANGPLLYLDRYPAETVVSALPAALGVLLLLVWLLGLGWRSPAWRSLAPLAALATAAVLHYLAYSVLGPAPFHWYYAPSVVGATLAGALGLGALASRSRVGFAPVRLGLGALGAVVVAGVVAAQVVVVLDRPVPWDEAAITTNWASSVDYERIGTDLRRAAGHAVVRSPGEIGTLAYYCQCDLVDAFSDRGRVMPLIDQARTAGGALERMLFDVNFLHLDRDQPAARPSLVLVYYAGPQAPGRWRVSSAWRGPGAFALRPVAPAP